MRWRRGPRLPAVTTALFASAAVLALASAAVAPYLAAAGNAATVTELARAGPIDAGLTITATGTFTPDTAQHIARTIDAGLGDAGGPTSVGAWSDPVSLAHRGGDDRVRFVTATDALPALELVEGEPAAGLLIPEVLAGETGLTAGDAVEVVRGDRRTATTIGGIYRDLDPATTPPVLERYAERSAPTPGREQRPLDLVFAEPGTSLGLLADVGAAAEVAWRSPATRELTGLADARRARARMLAVARAAEDPSTPLGSALDDDARGAPDSVVGLSTIVHDARRAVTALSGPARGVGIAGQGVALAVVAAAGIFAARARAVELRLATVRGKGPLRQGARAVVAALPALLGGTLAGWAAALGLVRVAGPPGSLPSGTAVTALRDVALALGLALIVLAAVTAGVVARTVRVGRRRRFARLSRAPWELVAVALAAIALLQLRAGGGVALDGGAPRLSPLVLAFPVLLLIGAVGLAVRAASRALPALRRIGGDRGHAGFFAVRRLATASTSGLALTAACALALGLVVYTASLSGSLAVAVEEKAVLQIGADATAAGDLPADDAALVLRARGRLAPTDELVDVLLVEPDRFAEVAYWDPALGGGRDLDTLLDGLARSDGERLPVLVAGLAGDAAVVDVPGFRVPIAITERLEVLPGMSGQRPLLIATRDVAAHLVPRDGAPSAVARADATPAGRWGTETWASGSDAVERLEAAGASLVLSSTDAAQQPRLVAVTWALGALQALAVLATALALVGVLLFVASRQRDTQVSYALARRMGLRPATHRLALSGEVLALLAVSLVAATVLGLAAAGLVASGLDPLPDLHPAPRAAWPLAALSVLAGALAAAGVGGAALLQRGADRANVAEVLRRG